MESQDTVSYSSALSNEHSQPVEKPYLKKELLYVIDNNGSDDYSRNQVQFETVSISNNGKWADYKNGFISIPLVCTLARSHENVSAADGPNLLDFKASNVNLIDSIVVDYGNNNVVQQNSNISSFCTFVQHTEFSQNEALLNEHTGYRLDSDKWDYDEGMGMTVQTSHLAPKFDYSDADQSMVLSNASLKASGVNCYEHVDGKNHVYYYDCIIRLKDLLFFDKMPLVRGANLKITLNLNQSDTTTTYVAGEVVSSVSSLKGSSNFMLRTSVDPIAGNGTEVLSLKVATNGAYKTQKRQCRLYIPVHTLAPMAEKRLLSQGQKTFIYSDLYVKMIKAQSGNFKELLTNSLARMKRLVIVPLLSQHLNNVIDTAADPAANPPVAEVSHNVLISNPQESIFASEPSTCSPCFIRDFNVQVSGSNIYDQNIQYKYEHFLNEMNGCYGLNANLETGSCSSLINMSSYVNNCGYMVVDLSRRYSYNDNTPLSIQIQGFIESAKQLDLLCFIEYEKSITVDLSTGARIA
jgi:hypothetical protein